jgi:hypothetical protein
MQPDIPAWIDWLFNRPWLFVFLFVAQWALVSYVISLLSGWMELSRRFRDAGAYYSYQWPFQSVRMRTIFGSYANCVNFRADETGLYMAVFRPFRLGHPPLFIPWSEVQVAAHSQGLIFKSRKLFLGRQELIPLLVRSSLAEKLQEAAGQGWPVETIAT